MDSHRESCRICRRISRRCSSRFTGTFVTRLSTQDRGHSPISLKRLRLYLSAKGWEASYSSWLVTRYLALRAEAVTTDKASGMWSSACGDFD